MKLYYHVYGFVASFIGGWDLANGVRDPNWFDLTTGPLLIVLGFMSFIQARNYRSRTQPRVRA